MQTLHSSTIADPSQSPKQSNSIFAICTVNENQFVTYSCKKCYNEIKELEHEIISKDEFEKYLN